MKLVWDGRAWEDYEHWIEADLKLAKAVNVLLRDIMRDPFRGLGRPEPLKHNLSGWWSRRISGEHRLVYRVVGKGSDRVIEIAACRYHYGPMRGDDATAWVSRG